MECGLGVLVISFIAGALIGKNWDKIKTAVKKRPKK